MLPQGKGGNSTEGVELCHECTENLFEDFLCLPNIEETGGWDRLRKFFRIFCAPSF